MHLEAYEIKTLPAGTSEAHLEFQPTFPNCLMDLHSLETFLNDSISFGKLQWNFFKVNGKNCRDSGDGKSCNGGSPSEILNSG